MDPCRPTEATPGDIPFLWLGKDFMPRELAEAFELPDVRTEYLPMFAVELPLLYWRSEFGPPPELRADVVARAAGPQQIGALLEPLARGYASWIENLRTQASAQHLAGYGEVTNLVLDRSSQSLSRIREGIDLLGRDPEVCACFQFMNEAMNKQYRWKSGRSLEWRPFQLAFILQCLSGVADPSHDDRSLCDLLWFPTGGGKTEAYLGLAVFTLALRRRRAIKHSERLSDGVGVISRYTLRLLTIQQFRRALATITSCELLRASKWVPNWAKHLGDEPWGGSRFSIGLWVGGNVTPNSLFGYTGRGEDSRMHRILGALEALGAQQAGYGVPEGSGEPAQVLNCPACSCILAIPSAGLRSGPRDVHLIVRGQKISRPSSADLEARKIGVRDIALSPLPNPGFCAVKLSLSLTQTIPSEEFDKWVEDRLLPSLGHSVHVCSVRASRPGYFAKEFVTRRNRSILFDFEIRCPNWQCELNKVSWYERTPLPARTANSKSPDEGKNGKEQVLEPFRRPDSDTDSVGIPIPAYTVDDQVYHRVPSMIVATVDKFARLAFEPRAAALFGNVNRYHCLWGYFREFVLPAGSELPEKLTAEPERFPAVEVPVLDPPDLIIQDELHLIEGPLGTMVGAYETAVGLLSTKMNDGRSTRPKYIASTATVRHAAQQVRALYTCDVCVFPPPGIEASDSFFALQREIHPLDSARPGRLYLGVFAPSRGALTPIVRIWSRLLQQVKQLEGTYSVSEMDPFQTLVGYFNAVRELAGAMTLYDQDIPQRLLFIAPQGARVLEPPLELSSRRESDELPSILSELERPRVETSIDSVFATSMFGTGVDVPRLSLMIVHGQPKTTSSYIQSTGRVGRQAGGLVVTLLRASRPRDLDHYEFFIGYHRALHRHVEPITVFPFSPRARERTLGPLTVTILRNAVEVSGQRVDPQWAVEQRLRGGDHASLANRMARHRNDPEVTAVIQAFLARSGAQPPGRRPVQSKIEEELESALDVWRSLAQRDLATNSLLYNETSYLRKPIHNVVLGDASHLAARLETAFDNVPQSLREIESTTGFQD